MHRKILILILASFFILVVLTTGLSILAAEPAFLPPLQVTADPSITVTVSAPLEPVLSTVIPMASREIDPEALILEDGWQFPINLSRSGATSG